MLCRKHTHTQDPSPPPNHTAKVGRSKRTNERGVGRCVDTFVSTSISRRQNRYTLHTFHGESLSAHAFEPRCHPSKKAPPPPPSSTWSSAHKSTRRFASANSMHQGRFCLPEQRRLPPWRSPLCRAPTVPRGNGTISNKKPKAAESEPLNEPRVPGSERAEATAAAC